MSEAFRADPPARHPLQTIIADSSRRVQALRNVSLIDNVALFSRIPPHTREAIRLEFELDGKLIAGARVLLLKAADLRFDAEQALNVVANFMPNHVRLREFSGRAEKRLARRMVVDLDQIHLRLSS